MSKGLLANILKCHDSEALATFENHVNEVGLALVRAHSGGLLLCKVKNGRPVKNQLFEDYVPIPFGSLKEETKRHLVDFILRHKSEAVVLDKEDRTGISGLYGSSFHSTLRKESAEADLIDAIADFLEEDDAKI